MSLEGAMASLKQAGGMMNSSRPPLSNGFGSSGSVRTISSVDDHPQSTGGGGGNWEILDEEDEMNGRMEGEEMECF